MEFSIKLFLLGSHSMIAESYLKINGELAARKYLDSLTSKCNRPSEKSDIVVIITPSFAQDSDCFHNGLGLISLIGNPRKGGFKKLMPCKLEFEEKKYFVQIGWDENCPPTSDADVVQ